MRRRNNRLFSALAASALMLTGCEADPHASSSQEPAATPAERPKLGLMTSLPLYWPEGADLAALATDTQPLPWQRVAIEARYSIVPLDTLSPIPALSPDAPEVDPLAGLERLAVIQPRGLSPADNVALDQWVRAGGRLLLVLDPVLTGEYQAALGDPRRPVDTALIPPVAARWGLSVSFDEARAGPARIAHLGEDSAPALPLALAGEVAVAKRDGVICTVTAQRAAAMCRIGQGRVTLIADAALFEQSALAGEGGTRISALMSAALN